MMSKIKAAYLILNERKQPLHVEEIISIALSRDLIQTHGKTPATTLNSDMLNENNRKSRKGEPTRFVCIGKGVWGLKEWFEQ
jgi:DNA-directed RNA polymerase delta subunit